MSTNQTSLFPFIRAAVLDLNPNAYIYSDAALSSQIDLTVLQLQFDPNNPGSVTGNSQYTQTSSGIFDNTLTVQQKLILSLETAIRLVSGQNSKFSYRSPVLAVSREGGKQELLMRLQSMLDDARGGKFSIETDTDFNAIIQGFDRYINDYDRATSASAWPGLPV